MQLRNIVKVRIIILFSLLGKHQIGCGLPSISLPSPLEGLPFLGVLGDNEITSFF
jgi:hypothetical protein